MVSITLLVGTMGSYCVESQAIDLLLMHIAKLIYAPNNGIT